MNLTLAQFFSSRNPLPGRRRLAFLLTLSLTVFLSTAVPALAEPVRINQVIHTLTPQGTTNLRLDTLVSQDPSSGAKSSTPQNGPRSEKQGGNEPLLSGITIASDAQSLGVEISEEGEVEGTVCDCGEILIAGGGFPKWPLVFLTAVPFIFINDCENCDPISTPTPPGPSPTPDPTPEPASLLLLGTGLLAAGVGFRRRYAKTKATKAGEEE